MGATDLAFHRTVIALSGNRHLATTAADYVERAHWFRLATLGLRDRPVAFTTSHGVAVEAIRRGDAEMAIEIHRLHRVRWAREQNGLIERLGLSGEATP
jgi:DNA-binding GntR family transcriptional regulator